MHVVILTTFDLDEYVFEALRVGASGFLVKDTEPVELLQAVRVVARGDALLSPGVTRRLVAEFATRSRQPHASKELDVLTEREKEIVALVGEGLSNDEIAERLVLSPATAKTHVSRAMVKLGVRDRAQLVVVAYQTGLVRPAGSADPAVRRTRSAYSRRGSGGHSRRPTRQSRPRPAVSGYERNSCSAGRGHGPDETLRRHPRGRRCRSDGPARGGLRIPRSERCRQDHDAADPDRADRADQRVVRVLGGSPRPGRGARPGPGR